MSVSCQFRKSESSIHLAMRNRSVALKRSARSPDRVSPTSLAIRGSCMTTKQAMIFSARARSLAPVAVCERMLLGNIRVTVVGLIIATFGVAFMFGGHPVIAAMLLLLAWVLVVLAEDMRYS